MQKLLVVNPAQRMTVAWYLSECMNLLVQMIVSLLNSVRIKGRMNRAAVADSGRNCPSAPLAYQNCALGCKFASFMSIGDRKLC